MINGLLPAVLTAVGQVASSVYQNHQSRKNMKYQAELNQDATDKMNAYNSPQAQMARFAAAGLNPDLIYGQQSNAQSSMVSTDAPPAAGFPTIGSAISAANSARLTQSQIDLNESQAEKNFAHAAESNANARRTDRLLDSQYIVDEVGKANAAKMRAEADRLVALTKNDEIQGKILSQKEIQERIESDHYEERIVAQLNLMASEMHLNDEQCEFFKAQAWQIFEKTPIEIAELSARADKESALADYYDGITATLSKEIWEASPYTSSITKNRGDDGRLRYDVSKTGQSWSKADQITHKTLGHLGKLVGIAVDVMTAGKSAAAIKHMRNNATEVWTETNAPNGKTTSLSTTTHHRLTQ